MKKVSFSVIVLLFFLQGCSREDTIDNTNLSSTVLCKKIMKNDISGENNKWIHEYIYNGNKLVKRTDIVNNRKLSENIYLYKNDLISEINKIQFYLDGSYRDYTVYYTYNNNGQIVGVNWDKFGQKGSITYIYNLNETISVYISDFNGDYKSSFTLTLKNGEIIKKEDEYGAMTTLTYDNKNSVFKNVIGNNSLFITGEIYPYEYTGKNNNCTKVVHSDSEELQNFLYDYNSSNYPKSLKATGFNYGGYDAQFFYE